MRWIAFIFVVFLFIPHDLSGAQTLGIDEVVKRLKEKREKTKDFSADLFQEKKVFLLQEKVLSKGRIRFKNPDKVSIEFFKPESSLMVFNGKTLLLYFKEEKTAERYQVEGNPVVGKHLLFIQDPFDEKQATWRLAEDRESVAVIEILPKLKEAPFVKTRLWVSKKNWMVTGMEMVERNGDTTLLRFSNLKVDSGLADSDFEIHLPEEVKITDIQ